MRTKKKDRGGAPKLTKRKLDEALQKLELFSRDSIVYLTIEEEFKELSPARAFDIFCHYCARRDKIGDPYSEADGFPERQQVIVERRKNQLSKLYNLNSNEAQELILRLNELHRISEHIFTLYMDIHSYDYQTTKRHEGTNNFSFDITASFSWGYISRFYKAEKREELSKLLMDKHISSSKELQNIYQNCTDEASLKALHTLLILDNQRISVTDVVRDPQSPFYLEDRSRLERQLHIDRFEDIQFYASEQPPLNSAKPYSYLPKTEIGLNMSKPIDYIHDMLTALGKAWLSNSTQLVPTIDKQTGSTDIEQGPRAPEELLLLSSNKAAQKALKETREKVMKVHKKYGSLEGKLTDILYLHDCKRFGFTNTWITDSMSRYKNKKNKSSKVYSNVSTSTFHAYKRLGEKMIDQKFYKMY